MLAIGPADGCAQEPLNGMYQARLSVMAPPDSRQEIFPLAEEVLLA